MYSHVLYSMEQKDESERVNWKMKKKMTTTTTRTSVQQNGNYYSIKSIVLTAIQRCSWIIAFLKRIDDDRHCYEPLVSCLRRPFFCIPKLSGYRMELRAHQYTHTHSHHLLNWLNFYLLLFARTTKMTPKTQNIHFKRGLCQTKKRRRRIQKTTTEKKIKFKLI